ncbi:hypothetical protein DFH08DRAFT_804791 [Mycena albidolilacea]|uniref:Uncharacterized protein n=1 Tax=Mycena albidolilacea TaxID=1033008 RepID=A0AAD7AA21_9AGAR|nr:hypothetical protein DFH08DRAFT_804791 [Mycena albidolilacea]
MRGRNGRLTTAFAIAVHSVQIGKPVRYQHFLFLQHCNLKKYPALAEACRKRDGSSEQGFGACFHGMWPRFSGLSEINVVQAAMCCESRNLGASRGLLAKFTD